MMVTWQDLKQLRAAGRRPELPIIVTLRRSDAWNVFTPAFCVIVHEPGTVFPVEQLEGLEVLLRMPCPKAAAVARLMRERGASPARCQCWCECAQELTQFPCRSCSDWCGLAEVRDAAAA